MPDQSRPPLRSSFDYEMTADELGKYGVGVVDKQVEAEHPGYVRELLRADSDVGRDHKVGA